MSMVDDLQHVATLKTLKESVSGRRKNASFICVLCRQTWPQFSRGKRKYCTDCQFIVRREAERKRYAARKLKRSLHA